MPSQLSILANPIGWYHNLRMVRQTKEERNQTLTIHV